jgi:hypothetical protein
VRGHTQAVPAAPTPGHGKRIRRVGLFALSVSLLLVLAVPFAFGAGPTRDEYTAQVEPICKADTKSNERILGGVRKQVKEGKLKPAATQFQKAATALKKALAELKTVPQPEADKAKLAKWLGYVKTEAELFESVAKKLKAGDKTGAQAMVIRLTHNANLANNQVLAFDFTYCRLEPSKFT